MQPITSYNQAAQVLATARWPETKGKPLSGYSGRFRLWKDGETFVVGASRNDTYRAVIYPDNTATLYFPHRSTNVNDIIATYTTTGPESLLGFNKHRLDTGVYALHRGRYNELPGKLVQVPYQIRPWDHATSTTVYYDRFRPDRQACAAAGLLAWSGMRVDLTTGKVINLHERPPVARFELAEHPENSRNWKRRVTDFNRTWKIATRIGAVRAAYERGLKEYSLFGFEDGGLSAAKLYAIIHEGELNDRVICHVIAGSYDRWRVLSIWFHKRGLAVLSTAFNRAYARNRPVVRELAGCFMTGE